MRISWGNLQDNLFSMQHRLNQSIWTSGIGRQSSGMGRMMVSNWDASGRKKKAKGKKDKMEKSLRKARVPQTDGEPDNTEEVQAGGMEISQDSQSGNSHEVRKIQDECEAAFLESRKNTEAARQKVVQEACKMIPDAAELQKAILWSEILGDPVSVKRRKKRVNQIYGN